MELLCLFGTLEQCFLSFPLFWKVLLPHHVVAGAVFFPFVVQFYPPHPLDGVALQPPCDADFSIPSLVVISFLVVLSTSLQWVVRFLSFGVVLLSLLWGPPPPIWVALPPPHLEWCGLPFLLAVLPFHLDPRGAALLSPLTRTLLKVDTLQLVIFTSSVLSFCCHSYE